MTNTINEKVETVCGGKLKHPEKYPSAYYRGEKVYFCTQPCLRAFEHDPDRFIAGEVEHPTHED
ncbi:MAG: YHS domain-containing protein [candidate division Zixibacteria bacterium]|nr:YHS domain-containing protein [Gammaproteobacteria bacterium]NIX54650.1 YHS domain-containing protein [candidate division Zixibacteria bacterium]